jgi:hypothetical protein
MVKRLIVVLILVAIAAIAGIVRSNSGASVELKQLVSSNSSGGQARDEVRKTFELSPATPVRIVNINGSVNIETGDGKSAEVYVERIGSSPEALTRRKVVVEEDRNGLLIQGEKGDAGFFARLFGSNPRENVTLKVPRQISLLVKGVNGSVVVGDLEGPVEVRGVNGGVQIAGTTGTAALQGINGNIVVALKQLDREGASLSGINGNIELQLGQDLNAYLDAKGLNGRVVSEVAGVSIEREKRGRYFAQIGSGGNSINAKGINGNIRLTRANVPATAEAEATTRD